MVKTALATILSFGLISVTVFGFAAVHGANMNHWLGCISTTISRTACPASAENPFVPVNYHFGALKTVSTATFGATFTDLIGAFLALAIVGLSFLRRSLASVLPQEFLRYARKIFEPRLFVYQKEFVKWLALHINSPALRFARA